MCGLASCIISRRTLLQGRVRGQQETSACVVFLGSLWSVCSHMRPSWEGSTTCMYVYVCLWFPPLVPHKMFEFTFVGRTKPSHVCPHSPRCMHRQIVVYKRLCNRMSACTSDIFRRRAQASKSTAKVSAERRRHVSDPSVGPTKDQGARHSSVSLDTSLVRVGLARSTGFIAAKAAISRQTALKCPV